jgi:phosphoribosylglycinamide formyltransferase-1
VNQACPVAVLISGNGSNLQALIDASRDSPDYRVIGVISNNPNAFGLQRAERAGIPTYLINHRDYPDRVSFDRALMAKLDELQPELIVLAGFMRILSREFVEHFARRILNIHPSLLPRYPGTNTHQRALDAGDSEHGVSVHFVTEDLDGGPVIAHACVPILPGDTAEQLQQRVHGEEHRIYPQVVALFASGRLRMDDGQAWLDDRPLPPNGIKLE